MAKNIKDLFVDELKDQLSSEHQIVKALPNMVEAAQSPDLKNAFKAHLQETKGQVKRLEKIFKLLDVKEKEKFCQATYGLIEECKEAIKEYPKSIVRDVALISKGQRIEHYEISAYGTLRTLAKELDLYEVSSLLKETLDEEGAADKKLTKIAVGGLLSSGINQKAIKETEETPKKGTRSAQLPIKSKLTASVKKLVGAKTKKASAPAKKKAVTPKKQTAKLGVKAKAKHVQQRAH